TSAKCKRVISAQLDCPASQSSHFSGLLDAISHPVIASPFNVTPRGGAVGRGEIRVEFDGFVVQPEGLADRLLGPRLIVVRHPPQIIVVSIEVFGRVAFCAVDLGLFELRCDRAHNAGSNPVLQPKNVLKCSIETVCPKMAPVAASISCPVTRTRSPDRRTLPSSTYRTPSSRPTCFSPTARPL